MDEIINEVYYMLLERISRECAQNDEVKALMEQKYELVEEITSRLGKDGVQLMDSLFDLSADLEDIEDKAMFRVALCMGTKIALN